MIDNIVLQLMDDGSYTLNTIVVPKEQLASRLREVFAPRRSRILFIKSGGQRTYGETIEAIDMAKGAGVEVVALARRGTTIDQKPLPCPSCAILHRRALQRFSASLAL
jgi:biopolymer transport protein ExbD